MFKEPHVFLSAAAKAVLGKWILVRVKPHWKCVYLSIVPTASSGREARSATPPPSEKIRKTGSTDLCGLWTRNKILNPKKEKKTLTLLVNMCQNQRRSLNPDTG